MKSRKDALQWGLTGGLATNPEDQQEGTSGEIQKKQKSSVGIPPN